MAHSTDSPTCVAAVYPLRNGHSSLDPAALNDWFPITHQRRYTSALMRQGGLTRVRAEYFVRLWAYLLLKQQHELDGSTYQPLTQLSLSQEFVSCSHREAAELFYAQKDKGSDRAAGMMIDRFVSLGLLQKQFDGQTLCLRIQPFPELTLGGMSASPAPRLQPDEFNPRTDAVPIANLIIQTYSELVQDTTIAAASHKTAKALRRWSQQYPTCLRVLRRQDNHQPVAISVLYPTASESDINFFLPPSQGFFLTIASEMDPFRMAAINDPECSSIYTRVWVIEASYLSRENLCLFLHDTQQTLARMLVDFPNICDIYSAVLRPLYEDIRLALGFQKTFQDPQKPHHWVYMALDRFLAVDVEQTLSALPISSTAQGY